MISIPLLVFVIVGCTGVAGTFAFLQTGSRRKWRRKRAHRASLQAKDKSPVANDDLLHRRVVSPRYQPASQSAPPSPHPSSSIKSLNKAVVVHQQARSTPLKHGSFTPEIERGSLTPEIGRGSLKRLMHSPRGSLKGVSLSPERSFLLLHSEEHPSPLWQEPPVQSSKHISRHKYPPPSLKQLASSPSLISVPEDQLSIPSSHFPHSHSPLSASPLQYGLHRCSSEFSEHTDTSTDDDTASQSSQSTRSRKSGRKYSRSRRKQSILKRKKAVFSSSKPEVDKVLRVLQKKGKQGDKSVNLYLSTISERTEDSLT